MALKQELMASSLPWQAANKLGLDTLTAFAAAGSGQSTATALTSNCFNVSSGSGGGVILPANTELFVGVNSSGGNVTLYPPVGSAINGGSVNAGFTMTTGKAVFGIPAGTNIIVNMSA